MTQKRGRRASVRRSRSFLLAMQVPIVLMLPVCAALAALAVFALNLKEAWYPYAAMAAFGLWALLSFSLASGLVVWVTRRRARALDAVFTPLGFQKIPGGLRLRGYRGAVSGRSAHIWFSQGPNVEVYMEARSGRRLGVGRNSLLAQGLSLAMGKTPFALDDDLKVWTADEAWARQWLAQPKIAETISALCNTLPGAIHSLVVDPESVKLQVRHFVLSDWTGEGDLSQALAQRWLDGLAPLAESLEAQPDGDEQCTALEIRMRTERGAVFRRALLGSLLFGFLLVTISAGVIAAVIWGSVG